MSRILIAYSTNSGSTAEVAETIAQELINCGHSSEARQIAEVSDLSGYDAVVIGAPMIFGWHIAARKFLKRYQGQLKERKLAYFSCAARLTQVEGEQLPQVPIVMDPNLVSSPEKPGRLTLNERFTTLKYYLDPMLVAAPQAKPVSIAFFKGSIQMYRLKRWQAAFVMIVVQAPPGDGRDWDFIKNWARSLGDLL